MRFPVAALFLIGLAALLHPAAAFASPVGDLAEVRLEPCDRLFVVPVMVEGRARTFLLDTGATTILDLSTFDPLAKARTMFPFRSSQGSVELSSVEGRRNVIGHLINVKNFSFAGRELHDLRFSAIDLSRLHSTCGRAIEGILGSDVLEQLEAVIDMHAHAARLRPYAPELFPEAKRQFLECAAFFNNGDAAGLSRHMDPHVQWFSPFAEAHGRDEVIQLLTEAYFNRHARLTITRMEAEDFHLVGDSYWLSYQYTIEEGDRSYRARGTLFCYRHAGEWLIAAVHNSLLDSPPSAPARAE